LPRAEGELAVDEPLGGSGKIHAAVEGLWQRVGRVASNATADALGIAGGARVEVGPLRIGGAGHYGSGLGFYYALEDTPSSWYLAGANDPSNADGKLRTYWGYYGQVMLVLGDIVGRERQGIGRIDVAGGYGLSHLVPLDGLDTNRTMAAPTTPPVLPKEQAGINAVFLYHIDDNLVADVDFFRANFSWYDGATQGVNTLNLGMTMTW
jgi:hypothetical protein